MMKKFTIYAGEKLSGLVDDQASFSFECDSTDIDTAYYAVADNVVLKNQMAHNQDVIDFEDCDDDDVETMLKDLKRMHFLSDYEISEVIA